MRLVREVKGVCHIGQSFKLSGFDESYRFIKPLYSEIHLGGKTPRLGESSFKLALGYLQGVKQVFDTKRTNVVVDQKQAFFDQQISRFRLLELGQ
jgi:hypothetical protein